MNPKLTPLLAPVLLLVCIAVVACTTTVPDTGRRQINFLNPAEEAALGLSEFQKIKQEKPISRDPRYNELVQRVGQRLSRVMPVPNAEWEFVVFEDSTPNAFALPGGKVGVHTGLFQITRDEAGLAAVIGHEVAHVVARHSGERLSRTAVAGVAVAGATHVMGERGANQAVTGAVLGGAALLENRKFSRKQELEADQLGALYMARAGYDPRASIGLWNRFAEWRAANGGNRMPVFLSTHPVDAVRIAELERFMPRALAEYRGG